MGRHKLGLKAIKMGAIAGDGDMGTSLVAIGDTVLDTAEMTTEEGTVTEFSIEESDSPVLSINTEPDSIVFAWSTYANDAATLAKLFGGTVTPAAGGVGELWEMPDAIPEIEQSLEIEWKKGGFMRIPRARIKAAFQGSFKKSALSQINITATVLQPTKAGVKRLTIENANT